MPKADLLVQTTRALGVKVKRGMPSSRALSACWTSSSPIPSPRALLARGGRIVELLGAPVGRVGADPADRGPTATRRHRSGCAPCRGRRARRAPASGPSRRRLSQESFSLPTVAEDSLLTRAFSLLRSENTVRYCHPRPRRREIRFAFVTFCVLESAASGSTTRVGVAPSKSELHRSSRRLLSFR
jgi:hypothetical protein